MIEVDAEPEAPPRGVVVAASAVDLQLPEDGAGAAAVAVVEVFPERGRQEGEVSLVLEREEGGALDGGLGALVEADDAVGLVLFSRATVAHDADHAVAGNVGGGVLGAEDLFHLHVF